MIPLIALLTCIEAQDLIDKIHLHVDLSPVVRNDLRREVRTSTPHCNWDNHGDV